MPWTSTFEPTVRVVSPSRLSARLLAPVAPSTIDPLPPRVWSPLNDRTLLLLTLTLPPPDKVKPFTTRSIPVPVARLTSPPIVTLLKKLLLLLVGVNVPVPVVLMLPPLTVKPFWMTLLPVPASMWPLPTLVTLPFRRNVPPFIALSVAALLVCTALKSINPPFTSAWMLPLLTRVWLPPAR